MELSATGNPVVTHADSQVRVGIDIEVGTLLLAKDDTDLAVHQAVVEFAAPEQLPWTAQEVRFAGKGPDGKSAGLTVDLLNDAWDGPRDGLPDAIWTVVALAATAAGDVGIRYAPPTS
ncbi:hypothetical protein ACWD4Z_37385 [Streptomyces antibioticus]